jgi:hypothetical protein
MAAQFTHVIKCETLCREPLSVPSQKRRDFVFKLISFLEAYRSIHFLIGGSYSRSTLSASSQVSLNFIS